MALVCHQTLKDHVNFKVVQPESFSFKKWSDVVICVVAWCATLHLSQNYKISSVSSSRLPATMLVEDSLLAKVAPRTRQQPLLWEGNSALYSIWNVIALPLLATCLHMAPLSSNTHLKFFSELFVPIIFLWDGNVVVLALLLAQQLIPWRKRESGCYCTLHLGPRKYHRGLVANRENQVPMMRNWANGSEFSCRVTSHRLEISSALRRQRKERPWSHSSWSGPSPTPPPSAGGPCLWPSACCRTPGWDASARIALRTLSIIMPNEFTSLVAQMNRSS